MPLLAPPRTSFFCPCSKAQLASYVYLISKRQHKSQVMFCGAAVVIGGLVVRCRSWRRRQAEKLLWRVEQLERAAFIENCKLFALERDLLGSWRCVVGVLRTVLLEKGVRGQIRGFPATLCKELLDGDVSGNYEVASRINEEMLPYWPVGIPHEPLYVRVGHALVRIMAAEPVIVLPNIPLLQETNCTSLTGKVLNISDLISAAFPNPVCRQLHQAYAHRVRKYILAGIVSV